MVVEFEGQQWAYPFFYLFDTRYLKEIGFVEKYVRISKQKCIIEVYASGLTNPVSRNGS